MILQPATRKILAVALIGVAIVSLFLIWRSSNGSGQQETTDSLANEQPVTLATAPLFLEESVEGTTFSLDSLGKTSNAVTLRLLFNQSVGGTVPVFVIDPTLEQNGWQVVLQQVSTDGLSFEVALLATDVANGTVFTQGNSIGTLLQANNLVSSVDSSVSLAVLVDGQPLALELASE